MFEDLLEPFGDVQGKSEIQVTVSALAGNFHAAARDVVDGVLERHAALLDGVKHHLFIVELIAVLAGQRQHQPRRTRNYGKGKIQEPSLLIDVQKKLAEGKGLGYAHWAKIFNTKELSKTLLYLQEHKLLDYADLKARTESLAARFNELSDQIKTAEKRMKEISELRTQIINYAKTHEVYEAYRKAGYSKKFLAEHESEIILHKAAKKTFDNLGLKKLPTVKSLSSEYAELLAEKKRTYAEFRAVREEMKVLYVAKSNIDKVMGTEEPEHGEHQKQKS